MGKKGGKSKDKKKKGPKGKKERAKAKLERQWGETSIVDPVVRKGKSRLLPTSKQQTTNELKSLNKRRNDYDNDDDDDYQTALDTYNDKQQKQFHRSSSNTVSSNSDDSENDDDEEEEIEPTVNPTAISDFVNNLKQISKRRIQNSSDDNDDDDSEQSVQSNDSSTMDDINNINNSDDNNVDDTITELLTKHGEPYSKRFVHYQSLPEQDDKKNQYLTSTIGELVKVSNQQYLPKIYKDENSELKVSKILLQKLGISKNVQPTTNNPNYFNKLSQTMLHLYYRDVLKRQFEQQFQRFDTIQSILFPFLTNYADMLITNLDSKRLRDAAQDIVLFHICNHIVTSRRRIQKHNQRIHTEENKNGESEIETNDDNDWKRDQGYTRPTVLVLLPTRTVCYNFVFTLLEIMGTTDSEDIDAEGSNLNRFVEEFGPPIIDDDDDGDDEVKHKLNEHRKKVLKQKGSEWNDLFGDNANADDDFKIGISFVPKKHVSMKKKKKKKDEDNDNNETEGSGGGSSYGIKFFTDFYKSDIILASPLGLKILASGDVGNDSDEEGIDAGTDNGKADFLSSIEICLLMRSEVMVMQNWDHVNDVLSLINQQPKKISTMTDFSRVRNYLLAGHASHWRQFITLSSFLDPAIVSSFKRYAVGMNGSAQFRKKYTPTEASFSDVIIPSQRQGFHRISCSSLTNQSTERIQYFKDYILPDLLKNRRKHTLIFIASYFDYIGIRNILLKNDTIDFVSVTEYTKNSEVTRNRTYFLRGQKSILLYTGRAHYFLRHAIKGVRHLLFFGLPEHANFYAEHINRLNEGIDDSSNNDDDGDMGDVNPSATCVTYYSKYEMHSLERIVGTKNCIRMLKDEKSTCTFSS